MKDSSELKDLPPYPFSEFAKFCSGVEKKDAISIIRATIGIPDREAPEAVKQSMSKNIRQKKSTYAYPIDEHGENGTPELIDAIIADYDEKHGADLKPENIAVTSWTKEVLHNLPRLLEKGRIQIPVPIYPAYIAATLLAGHTIKKIPTSAENGWIPEFEFESNDVAFYFCDPDNPTGRIADRNYYEELLDKMKRNDVTGFIDKAYKDFIFDPNVKSVSIAEEPDLMDHAYEIVSLSKHYNFVGIGVGWIVSSEENINKWLKLYGQFGQGVEWYEQMAAVEALTNPEVKKEMQNYMQELKNRRDVFANGLNKIGLKTEVPKATPYLISKVPDGYDDEDFVKNELVKKAHVAFMPLSYFGGKGHTRETIYISEENITEILRRIENANIIS